MECIASHVKNENEARIFASIGTLRGTTLAVELNGKLLGQNLIIRLDIYVARCLIRHSDLRAPKN